MNEGKQETSLDVPDYPHTFRQFEQKFGTLSEPALRHKYFESKPRESSRGLIEGNGLAGAFLKVDGRVYVKPRTLFELMSRRSA
jgi:hypothetical protein